MRSVSFVAVASLTAGALAGNSCTTSTCKPSLATNPGTLVASEVQSTIAADTKSVIAAFSGSLPSNVRSVVTTALNLTVLQQLSGTTNDQQLNTLSSAISTKLASVEAEVHAGITDPTKFLGQAQGANYTDLRACIAQVVKQAGMASGQRCLTMNNTAAVSDIQALFGKIINQYEFLLPIDTVTKAQAAVNAYLSKSSLIAPAQQLVKDTEASILSVTAAVAGDQAQALYAAEACFFEALAQPVYTQAYEYNCLVNSTTSSALISVENTFRDTVNQYAGVLPPTIVSDIQAIGSKYLSNISSADNKTRNDIEAAILSVVASTSGNEATITGQLIDCINQVLIPGQGNATTEAACQVSPGGVAQSRVNIINGYIQQFYGVLPPLLVSDLEAKIIPTIGNCSASQQSAIKTKLNALFTASGAGPAYVSCFESYESCVLAALGNKTISATCPVGAACKYRPFPTGAIDETSPYAAAANVVAKAGKKPCDSAAMKAAAKAARARAEKEELAEAEAALKAAEEAAAKGKGIKKKGSKKHHRRAALNTYII